MRAQDKNKPTLEAIPVASALSPKSISYRADAKSHLVTDEELELLVKLEKPYQAAAGLLCFDVAIPLIPQALLAIRAIMSDQPVTAGALSFALLVGTIVGALAFGINAARGHTDAERLLRDIRNRPTMPTR